jgi:hypothetical protein
MSFVVNVLGKRRARRLFFGDATAALATKNITACQPARAPSGTAVSGVASTGTMPSA